MQNLSYEVELKKIVSFLINLISMWVSSTKPSLWRNLVMYVGED